MSRSYKADSRPGVVAMDFDDRVWKRLAVRDAGGGVLVTNWYLVSRDDDLADLRETIRRDGMTVLAVQTKERKT